MPVSDDTVAIMAAIILAAPTKPNNTYGTMGDCLRVARDIERELDRFNDEVAELPSERCAAMAEYDRFTRGNQ